MTASEMGVRQPSEVVKLLNTVESSASGPSEFTTLLFTKRTALTHLNDALLAQLDLPAMESFWFTAKDGAKLQGFLIRPPGFDPAKKYPLKFLMHGGPQGA